MKKVMVVIVALFFLLLSGCQSAATVAPGEEAQAQVGETEETEIALPTATALAALPAPTDYCLECHTDQEKLTSLAKPEVAHDAESKGVG